MIFSQERNYACVSFHVVVPCYKILGLTFNGCLNNQVVVFISTDGNLSRNVNVIGALRNQQEKLQDRFRFNLIFLPNSRAVQNIDEFIQQRIRNDQIELSLFPFSSY